MKRVCLKFNMPDLQYLQNILRDRGSYEEASVYWEDEELAERFAQIKYWWIEFDALGRILRELGNKFYQPYISLKLPSDNLPGFWLASGLKKKDFIGLFEAEEIQVEWFDDSWRSFDKLTYGFTITSGFRRIWNALDDGDPDDGDFSYLKTVIWHKGRRKILKANFNDESGNNTIWDLPITSYEHLSLQGVLYESNNDEILCLYDSKIIEIIKT